LKNWRGVLGFPPQKNPVLGHFFLTKNGTTTPKTGGGGSLNPPWFIFFLLWLAVSSNGAGGGIPSCGFSRINHKKKGVFLVAKRRKPPHVCLMDPRSKGFLVSPGFLFVFAPPHRFGLVFFNYFVQAPKNPPRLWGQTGLDQPTPTPLLFGKGAANKKKPILGQKKLGPFLGPVWLPGKKPGPLLPPKV